MTNPPPPGKTPSGTGEEDAKVVGAPSGAPFRIL
jgi:hypothetical protein